MTNPDPSDALASLVQDRDRLRSALQGIVSAADATVGQLPISTAIEVGRRTLSESYIERDRLGTEAHAAELSYRLQRARKAGAI
jgi:hypothetical protein